MHASKTLAYTMALGSLGHPMKQISLRSMNPPRSSKETSPFVIMIAAALFATTHCARAQTMKVPGLTVLPQSYGPYSGHFLQGGIGLTKPLPATDPIVKASCSVDNVCLGRVFTGANGAHADCGSRRSKRRRLPFLRDRRWNARIAFRTWPFSSRNRHAQSIRMASAGGEF